MRHCTFCGTDLPEQAQFCGYCGRLSMLSGEQPVERPIPSSTWSSQNDPTIISDTSLPTMMDEQTVLHSQQEEQTLLTPHNNAIWTPPVPQRSSEEDELDRRRRAMVWGVPLSGANVRGPAGAPVVQGTPHINNVPLVSGTPQLQMVGQPMSSPAQQSFRRTQFEQQTRYAQMRPASTRGRLVKGTVTRWTVVIACALLVLATAGVGVALAVSPSLALSGGLSGNTVVVPGQRLVVHGSSFLPGGHITLKRDTGQTVQIAAQNIAMSGKNASSAMSILSTFSPVPSASGSVTVNANGTFDASLLVGNDWSLGEHTIRATEDIFSRSATMTVNVDDAPPELSVSPASLACGSVQEGITTPLSLTIGNTGGKPLSWTATNGGAKWLKLQLTSGEVLPDGPAQPLVISCDTQSLALGSYSATIHIDTDGGTSNIKVALNVVAQKQARLSVSAAALDFQMMDTGQQATKVISINNTGTLKLDWQVTSNENWVSLAPSSGSILPGDIAQKVAVQVDTTGLQAGSYSATLTVGSNGGASQIAVFLVIAAPVQPTATPIPPTPVPPTATPTPVPQGRICKVPSVLDFGKVSQGQAVIQPVTLGNCGGTSFTWSVQSKDTWVTVDKSGSTLDPNTTTAVNVTVDTRAFSGPGTYQSTVTFYTSVGNQTVNVTVTVVPAIPISVTPTLVTPTPMPPS